MTDYYIKALDTTQLILYCSFIYYLSDQTVLATPMLFAHQDKLFHMGAYFILAAFSLRAFRHFIASSTRLIVSSLVFASLYGVSDEWHQAYVPNRMNDIADWGADTLGAALFLAGYYVWLKKHEVKN